MTDITVHDWREKWLRACEASGVAMSTVFTYERKSRHFATIFQGRRLRSISTDDITNFYIDMRSKHSPAYVHQVHVILSQMFARAAQQIPRILDYNPMDGVQSPKPPRQKKKVIPTIAQVKAILAYSKGTVYFPMLVLMMSSGLRPGEVGALEWSDFEEMPEGQARISVSKSWTRIGGGHGLSRGKSGHRHVIIDAMAAHVIRAWRAHVVKAYTDMKVQPPELLFIKPKTGGPVYPTDLMKGFASARAKAGVAKNITPHSLRHLHASLLLEEGHNVTAVSARLGHSTPATTLKVYAHVLPLSDEKAAASIGGMMKDLGI